jgi:hypothetical protein
LTMIVRNFIVTVSCDRRQKRYYMSISRLELYIQKS